MCYTAVTGEYPVPENSGNYLKKSNETEAKNDEKDAIFFGLCRLPWSGSITETEL